MPIYEYRCIDCAESFEALVSASDPRAQCPSCHSANLSRELSVFASSRSDDAAMAAGGGGGCCGGGCGCARR